MLGRLRLELLLLVFLLVGLACSDEDDPVGGGTDTHAPLVTSVTAIDLNHLEARFSENVQRESAELPANYSISGDLSPLPIGPISLKADQRTVVITTDMIETPYELTVTGVQDVNGNAIQEPITVGFMGTHDPDVTPPEVVYRSPAPNATGVAIDAPIVIQFSERIRLISLTISPAAPFFEYEPEFDDDLTRLYVYPITPMASSTEYTIRVGSPRDEAGNEIEDVSWSFVTAAPTATTRPTVVASTPHRHQTNVDVVTEISITFSEPMMETDLELQTSPAFQVGSGAWSVDGKTWQASLLAPLDDDQLYTFTVAPNNNARDLDGNPLIPALIRFSTGNTITFGGVAGVLSGDEQSNFAGDPTGALVFAEPQSTGTGAWVYARRNGFYSINYLPADDYRVMALLETNGNVFDLDPATGDAFGVFGLDIRNADHEEATLSVVEGEMNDDGEFPLYDPSAITGRIEYAGAYSSQQHHVGVGLFDVNEYTPGADPDYATDASWPDSPKFAFVSYETGPTEGTYYLGAFLDLNDNLVYDDGEPVGFLGGDSRQELSIAWGSDHNGLVITIEDASVPLTLAASSWRITKAMPNEWLARLTRAIDRIHKSDVHARP